MITMFHLQKKTVLLPADTPDILLNWVNIITKSALYQNHLFVTIIEKHIYIICLKKIPAS